MAFGRVPKIYLGWAAIVTLGLGAFVLARNSVGKNRYAVMKTREKIRDQARSEHREKTQHS